MGHNDDAKESTWTENTNKQQHVATLLVLVDAEMERNTTSNINYQGQLIDTATEWLSETIDAIEVVSLTM